MKQIPNIFTLLNLVCGCLATVCFLQPGESLVFINGVLTEVNLPENLTLGAIFIGIAAVVDFLDGFVARLFKATSPLGAQLDSLADVVSFGAAPGFLLWQLLRMAYARGEDGLDVSQLVLLPAFLFPMAIAYRLGRFNVDPTQQYGFKGVPAPAAGLMIVVLPLLLQQRLGNLNHYLLSPWVLYAIIGLMSYLAISTLPLMALKFQSYGWKGNEAKWLLLLIAIVSGIFLQWFAIPVVFLAYIAVSLLANSKKQSI